MAILYATGWEAGSLAWYTSASPAWVSAGFSSLTSDPPHLHRTATSIGGNYSMRGGNGFYSAPGLVSTSARWLMFWARPDDTRGSTRRMQVQFGRNGTAQVNVRFFETGNIIIYRGSTTVSTHVSVYNGLIAHWFAIKVVAQDSGSVEVWVDGALVASASGDFKQHATLDDWDQIGWAAGLGPEPSGGAGMDWVVDDVLITDDTRLPEYYAPVLTPNGNSSTIQLTPSAGTNWQNVDEIPVNDADYNRAISAGQEDFYTFSNLTVTPTSIACVNVLARVRTEAVGGAITQAQIGVSGSDATVVYQTAVTLPGGTFVGLNYVRETQPNGGTWDATSVNAANFGIKFI
jgi:hypothetical protein